MTVLASAPRRVRLWIVLAAWAGLRACEIAGLRAESIRLGAAPCIVITAEATKGQSERIVQLCDFAVAEIRAAGLPRRGWAFARADGLPGPNTPHRVSVLANTLLRECGIPDTFHGLRHRCLTQLYNATLDLRLVQEFAGHRRPETTAVYTKVADGKAMAAVQLLPVPQRLRVAG
jgi:integrase/recombinase XerC/integrase/recombinase XerD